MIQEKQERKHANDQQQKGRNQDPVRTRNQRLDYIAKSLKNTH